MNNKNIFASISLDWKTFLIGIAILVLALIVLHLIFNVFRLKSKTKNEKRKLEKSFNEDSLNIKKILSLTGASKKYTGKFKSYSGSEKKKIKKFLLDWLKKVPLYVEINHKANEKKNIKLFIALSKDPSLDKFFDQWVYKNYSNKTKKNAKKNLKKLIKFMNKNACAMGILDVLCHIFEEDKNFKNLNEPYYTSENHIYITYYVNKRKK